MQKRTFNKLSATARAALLDAGFIVTKRGALRNFERGYEQPDRHLSRAVVELARAIPGLGVCKTKEDFQREIAAGLEDYKIEISRIQDALAPGVSF